MNFLSQLHNLKNNLADAFDHMEQEIYQRIHPDVIEDFEASLKQAESYHQCVVGQLIDHHQKFRGEAIKFINDLMTEIKDLNYQLTLAEQQLHRQAKMDYLLQSDDQILSEEADVEMSDPKSEALEQLLKISTINFTEKEPEVVQVCYQEIVQLDTDQELLQHRLDEAEAKNAELEDTLIVLSKTFDKLLSKVETEYEEKMDKLVAENMSLRASAAYEIAKLINEKDAMEKEFQNQMENVVASNEVFNDDPDVTSFRHNPDVTFYHENKGLQGWRHFPGGLGDPSYRIRRLSEKSSDA